MNKIDNYYYRFVTICLYMNILNYVHAIEPIPDHLNYKGKYTSDIKDYEIVVPQRVNKDGDFISHLVSHHHSKRSTEDMDFIFYKIPIAGKEYLIELTPNRKLISPGAVVEIHEENKIKLNKRNSISNDTSKENLGKMFENLNIKKLENTECHFSGHVKGENISKAALSTCYGLAGFIQIRKGFYTIEPVAGHNPFVEDAYPHILYKADGLENSSVCQTVGELASSLTDQVIRKRRESNTAQAVPLYTEILIVMDKTLINYHQDSDCENYVLTVFNMASNLFHDASLGLLMTLTIVRIIRLEVEDDEMNLRVNADAEKTLRSFQTWQYEINPGDDTHPNHHDIAVLITRVDVCYSPSSCGLLGLTTIGKACDPRLSAAVCEDNGLRLGFVIAHEIGHLLGAEHDSTNATSCNGTDACGLRTVMHPRVSLTAQTWSKCSQEYFKTFFENGLGQCLVDEPEEHHFNVQDLLPGVMYNADFQCKHIITMDARECDMGSTCDSLNCHIPGFACILTHTPPADGTHCGENMWCHNTKCLVVGERPGAVDGNWGEWSAWSDCSRTCGSGVASSVRNCDKPLPSHGGKNCIGDRKRYKICAATPCETGRPSFRDIQCGEFDDWIYPEDGKKHTWKAHYVHDDNPCTLYCINEDKQITALRPRVVDGTMCYRGIRDICVGGICRNLPCDLHFESNAIEDACGVCHGDGTGCEFAEGRETFTKLPKGLTKLVNVPSGTRNVKVEEMEPTLARIVVRDKETKDIYVRGKTLGMFTLPGTQAWLGMIKKNQEALSIPGPVSKPLSIWIQRLENVTVKWSMALPAEQQRKPEFGWDYLKWGPCSARCGPGTQKSEPSCMEEKAGLVEDSFCADLEMPPSKVRPCEIVKCVARWMVGDWKGCDVPGSSKKERKRVVYCIKPIGEGEGESQIVSDSECKPPKPHDRESCESRQKREDAEYGESDYSFLKEASTYRSDTVDVGFHEKYEDYLKNFAAFSTPQRKSETIPVYLVASPHFKDYFPVLQAQYNQANLSSNTETWLNGTTTDDQTEGKISAEFYKNTKADLSEIKSKISTKQRKSISPEDNNLDGFDIGSQTQQRNWESTGKNRNQLNMEELLDKIRKTRFLEGRTNLAQQKDNSSWRKARGSKHKLFPILKHQNNFNYSSPNLTNLIENMDSVNEPLKRKYLSVVEHGKPTWSTSPFAKWKWKNFQMNAYNPKSLSSRLSSFLNPFSHFKKSSDKNKAKSTSSLDKSGKAEIEEQITRLRKLKEDEFDGSGIKKQSFDSRPCAEESEKVRGGGGTVVESVDKSLFHERRNFFSNPFDPTHTGKMSLSFRKANFKDRNVFEKDMLLNRGNGRLRNKDALLMSKRSIKPTLKGRNSGVNRNRPKRKSRAIPKVKRSSHKKKKVKPKESSAKSKESSGIGCGMETKNYLNSLFRDSHPKPSAKPEQKAQSEKPVINAGQIVVDKDSADDNIIEVLYQDEDDDIAEGMDVRFLRSPHTANRVTYKGQQVFDLYQKLQHPEEFGPDYESDNSTRDLGVTIDFATETPETTVYTLPVSDSDTTTSDLTHATTLATTPASSSNDSPVATLPTAMVRKTNTSNCSFSDPNPTSKNASKSDTEYDDDYDEEETTTITLTKKSKKKNKKEKKKKPKSETKTKTKTKTKTQTQTKTKTKTQTKTQVQSVDGEEEYFDGIDYNDYGLREEGGDSYEETPQTLDEIWRGKELLRRWLQRYR